MNHRIPVILAALALGAVLLPRPAGAASQKDTTYEYDDVWPTAVRFLRIDEKLKITEKDSEAGYVLFELTDDGKVFAGALELARVKDYRGRPALRLILRIEDRPSYMEQGIIKRLFYKLHRELGPPPPPKMPSKKKPAKKPKKPKPNQAANNGKAKP